MLNLIYTLYKNLFFYVLSFNLVGIVFCLLYNLYIYSYKYYNFNFKKLKKFFKIKKLQNFINKNVKKKKKT